MRINFSADLYDIQTPHPVDHVVNMLPHVIDPRDNSNRIIMIVLCFSTPFEILTRDGIQTGDPGDCFIVGPTFPEYHRAVESATTGFINDWIHVRVERPSNIEELDLPLNTVIKTGDPMFIRDSLIAIRQEVLYRRDLHERLVSIIIEQMLIRLRRAYDEQEHRFADSQYHDRLLELRQEMAGALHEKWTVCRMAEALNLSNSRLTVLYREQFNVSPLEDLILLRLTSAKKLLLSSNLPLKSIAVLCGFQNEYYFSRIFKSKVGTSPGTYRRR